MAAESFVEQEIYGGEGGNGLLQEIANLLDLRAIDRELTEVSAAARDGPRTGRW